MVTTNTVLLIPESTRKAKGGDPHAGAVDGFADALPKAARDELLTLRTAVAAGWKNEAGRDGVMPACMRYRGNMYRHIPREAWEARTAGVEVLIVSGLYGVVASRDTVFAYPHSMAEKIEPFGKMNCWWRDAGLPGILAAYLRAVRPKAVVDLLSKEYRHAVEGYPEGLAVKVQAIDFRGMGRASQPKRGERIAEALRGGRP